MAGWTLCHGAGGPAAVVALAADVLGEAEHRTLALAAAAAYVGAAGTRPEEWPCGLRGADGDVSLVNGVAGTAVLLADLVRAGHSAIAGAARMGGVRPAGSAAGGLGPRVVAGRAGRRNPLVLADGAVRPPLTCDGTVREARSFSPVAFAASATKSATTGAALVRALSLAAETCFCTGLLCQTLPETVLIWA